MKWVLFAFLLAIANVSFATEYFVGGAGASDSNPGTAAAPFATINKAASVAKAGDIVTIRGGVYRETVTPANSGSGGNPIIFRSDAGASVTISGLESTGDNGWVQHTGNIYKKTINLPVNGYATGLSNFMELPNTKILANQVFKDGDMMIEARWPKGVKNKEDLFKMDATDVASTSGWRYRGQFGGGQVLNPNQVIDQALSTFPGGSLTGATLVSQGWYVRNSATVTSHSGTTLNLATHYVRYNGQQFWRYYYLTGQLQFLSQEREYFYKDGTLYFWQPGGGAPTGVEFKARNHGFDLRNRSYITINNIKFTGCEPVTGNGSTSFVTIDNIRASYMNHSVTHSLFLEQGHGMGHLMGTKLLGTGNVVKNSEFAWSANMCIWAGANTTVENNLMHHIGYDGMWGAGVGFWGTDNVNNIRVIRNTMHTLGRGAVDNGFAFVEGQIKNTINNEIAYNNIYDFCKLNHDGGAFYSWGYQNISGLRIHHNWFHDMVSFRFPNSTKTANLTDGIMAAVYFDMGSGPVSGQKPNTVDHNVFWNIGTENGVNVTGWADSELTDVYTQPSYKYSTKGPANYYNNTFADNIKTYVTYQVAVADVFRNNISRKDLNFSWGGGPSNVQNSILKNVNPQFSSGDLKALGGLYFRPSATSPARDMGVAIPGITDGSVGVPDAGAYEFGGEAWVPGYVAVPQSQPANTPPVVSITAPANNSTFAKGAAINITANATDNGSITRVEFFDGTKKIGEDLTAPYAYSWTTATTGSHSITAKATDNLNATTTSAAITISVTAPSSPTVSITSPADNAKFNAGANIVINATAADADGTITKVEFYNGATKLGEDNSSPYSFTWSSPAAGAYALTAKATNNNTATTTSTAVNVTVVTPATPGVPNKNPLVSITGPANNTSFEQDNSITITANASDPNGSVIRVEFFDGSTKLGEDTSSPYNFAWANAPVGTHVVTAKAHDNEGATTTSSAINIIVAPKPVPGNEMPSVSLTSPGQGKQFATGEAITMTVEASDPDGKIVKVEFFAGGTKVGEATSEPFTFTWTNPEAGNYELTAIAWDDKGSFVVSDKISISIATDPKEEPAGEARDIQAGIPRFFSPNGDGQGDFWIWANDTEYANASVRVFTRAGSPVYTSSAYTNSWDGKSDGQPLQDGDYYYVIRLQNTTELRGAVRIIR